MAMYSRSAMPTTMSNDDAAGDVSWVNITNATADDDAMAYVDLAAGQSSQWIVASGFDFNLPRGATVTGFEVSYDSEAETASVIQEIGVALVKGGVIGAVLRTFGLTAWLLTRVLRTTGSDTDKWTESWTASDVSASDFGVALRVENTGVLASEARVDYIQVTVHYDIERVATGVVA